MPKRISALAISGGMPRKYTGAKIKPSEDLGPQAERALKELPGHQTRINPHNLSLQRFEEGLRRAIRWEELRTGFNLSGEVTVRPYVIAKILSEEIFSPSSPYGPIYQREEVIDLAQARDWLRRFLYAMEHPSRGEDFDLLRDPKTFFVRGPLENLVLGLEDDPHFARAAFPQLNLGERKFCYVKPVLDNLAALQFRALDPQERLVRKYAYDASVPEYFSIYTYQEEERRQFEICNQAFLSEEEKRAQREGLENLKDICRSLFGMQQTESKTGPALRFKIVGPARRIILDLGKRKTVGFHHLHLEPAVIYEVEIAEGDFPITGIKTIVVKFREKESRRWASIHYFSWKDNTFVQIFSRQIDHKNRTAIPKNFIPRVWDDEGDLGLVL